FEPDIFRVDLDGVIRAFSGADSLPLRIVKSLFNGEYKEARGILRGCCKRPDLADADLLHAATLAQRTLDGWAALAAQASSPVASGGMDGIAAVHDELEKTLQALSNVSLGDFIASTSFAVIETTLDALLHEDMLIRRFPELHSILANLHD